MILSDYSIQEAIDAEEIRIEPFDIKNLQPASYDVTLYHEFILFQTPKPAIIANDQIWFDPATIDPYTRNDLTYLISVPDNNMIINPGQFMLGSTVEIIGIGSKLVGRLEGKSSLGRLGLFVHVTAGYVDPGWYGRLTFELLNVSPYPIELHPGMKVAQISFEQLSTEARRKYGDRELGSHYHGDMGPNTSRMWEK